MLQTRFHIFKIKAALQSLSMVFSEFLVIIYAVADMFEALSYKTERLGEVIEFFITLPNPSSRTVALGLSQPLTEMSIRKSGRHVKLTI
jgi:hypothetical protein